MSLENAQRDPDSEPPSIRKVPQCRARLPSPQRQPPMPKESEARLRLIHVLLELNDLTDASRVLAEHDWTPDGAAFEYLARLFEGDLHERRGNRPAAAAAYDRAIALVAMPQAAAGRARPISRTSMDERSQAAATVTPALATRSDQSDPWWPYIRGQAWRFESYLKIAHSMVIK